MKKYRFLLYWFWVFLLCAMIIARIIWGYQPTNIVILVVLATPLIEIWGDHIREKG